MDAGQGVPSAPDGTAFANFFAGMVAIGAEYAGAISGGRGGKWYCPIPGHDDEHASFDVHIGSGSKQGMVVFTCTPCRDASGQDECYSAMRRLGVEFLGRAVTEAEIEAGSLDFGPAADLTGPTRSGKTRVQNWKPITTYRYNWFDGSPNFAVERLEDADWVAGKEGCGPKPEKTFRSKRWDDALGRFKGGSGALDKVERTPLHFELFEDWADTGKHIYLVEGEKADAALIAAGARATCFHGGTAGKRMDGWALEFKRFSEVWVWTDLDEAGLKWAVGVRDELKAVGVKVKIVCNAADEGAWVPKGDAVEHLAAVGAQRPRTVTGALAAEIKALHPMPSRTVARGIARGLKALKTMGIQVPVAPTGAHEGMIPFDPNKSPRPAAAWFLSKKGLLTDTELRLRAVSGEFFLWRGTHYSKVEDAVLAEKVADYFDQKERPAADPTAPAITIDVKKNTRGEVLAALDGLCMSRVGGSDDSELRAMSGGEGGVPFHNGWLDIGSGSFTPHTSSRFTTWCVPGDYAPGEWAEDDTPLWSSFLDSIGYTEGTENRRILRQWFGYVLSGLTNVDKAMILRGERRAGKGTVLHVLKHLVGSGHFGMNMQLLTNDFGLQPLIGKSLVTVDDAKWANYNDQVMERLLSLTAFGDVPVNIKYGAPRSMVLGARWTFASNDLPRFSSASNALAGRFLVLQFEKSFYGKEDLSLKRRLLAELPGIAKWALGGLEDLVSGGGRFTVSAAQREIEAQMEREGSQVRTFLYECVQFGDGEKDSAFRVGQSETYRLYRGWAEFNGMRPLESRTFYSDMRTALPVGVVAKSSVRLPTGGSPTRGWVGMRVDRAQLGLG